MVVLGLLLTLVITAAATYVTYQKQQAEFRDSADRSLDALGEAVERDLERARHLALLIRAGASIDGDDPPDTLQPAGDSGLEFLAWLEPAGGGTRLQVTPLLSATAPQAVASRVLEADADTDSPPRQALDKALASGELTATDNAVLFQGEGDAASGFMAFLPVPHDDGIKGVVALGLRMDRLTTSARDGRDLHMHIFSGDNQRLLMHGPGENADVAEHTAASTLENRLHARRELDVASQRWTVYVTPTDSVTWSSALAIWPLAGGLLLTGLAGLLAGRQRGHALAVEKDLTHTHQRLSLLQRDYAATRATLDREALARASAEHCQDLFEHCTSAVVLRLSATDTILGASPATDTILGHAPEALTGRQWHEFLAEDGPPPGAIQPNTRQTFLLRDATGSTREFTGVLADLPPGMSNAEARLLVLQPSATAAAPADARPDEPFREAFDAASTGMALFHPRTGQCLYVNQALCDSLGYAQDELLNMTYHQITHPADQYATREQMDAIRNASGSSFRVEKRYLHKTGRVLWVEVTGSILRDSKGQERYVASQIRDITEHKQTEQALQQINHRHDLILNAVAEAIFGLDTHGRVVFANDAACHMLSREPATIEGQRLGTLLRRADDPGPEDWPIRDCLEEQQLKQEDGVIFRRGDGTAFPADYTISPMIDDGRVTGAVVVMADASERQEGEARFRSAFEDVAVGMALIDLDGRFLRANQALCTLVGHDRDELLAMHSTDLLHPDDHEPNYRVNRLLLEGHRPTGPLEHRLCHRDGGVVWALTSTSLVRDPGGEPRYLLKEAQDITPRKVAEGALRISEARFRGTFDQAAIGMALLAGDQARVQRINQALQAFLQCDEVTLTERPFPELVHPDDRTRVGEALARPTDAGAQVLEIRIEACRQEHALVRVHLARIDDDGSAGQPLHLLQLDPAEPARH